jgi:hypothetical protein
MNKPYLEDLKGNGHMVRTMTVVDEIKINNPGYPKPMFYVQILEANGIHQPEIPLGTAHIRFGRYESREVNGKQKVSPTSVPRYPIAVFDNQQLQEYLPSAKNVARIIRDLEVGTARKVVFPNGTSEFTFTKHNDVEFSFTWRGIKVKPGTNVMRKGTRTAIVSIEKWNQVAGLLLNDLKV